MTIRRSIEEEGGIIVRPALLALLAVCTLVVAAVASAAKPESPRVVKTSTLPAIGLAAFQRAALPGSVPLASSPTLDDRGIELGGIGSDLYRDASMDEDEFYMVTDRGPNTRPRVSGERRRTFPNEWFTPTILHVDASGPTLQVLDVIPIVTDGSDQDTACDDAVTGLPNLPTYDEKPYNFNGTVELMPNPNGLDTEGLVRAPNGDFWLVDEYSPSLIRVGSDGCVEERFVPALPPLASGYALTPASYHVSEAVPRINQRRRQNRGFEGLAIHGNSLFVAIQSPLLNPNSSTGQASRNTRILRFDLTTEQVTAEWLYRFDEVCAFSGEAAGCGISPDEMKVSGLVALSDTRLLVQERTDLVTKIYAVDLTEGNRLDAKWSDPMQSPTLESLSTDQALADEGVAAPAKWLVADLTGIVPEKIEGIAVVNPRQIAVANDNDFQLTDGTSFDANGNVSSLTGVPSQVLRVWLPKLLPG
jgi:hypothetical protein